MRAGPGATATGLPTAGRAGKGIARLTAVRAVKVAGHPTAAHDRKGIARLTAGRAGKGIALLTGVRGAKAIGRHSIAPGAKGANPSIDRRAKAIGRRSIALDRMEIVLRIRDVTPDSPSIARGATIDHREPIARGRTTRAPNVRPQIGRGKIDRAVTAVRRSIGRADRAHLAEGIGRAATSAVRQGNSLRARSARQVSICQS